MSDMDRWSNIESYNETWNPRTELLASLIEPNKTVIEFGAGINPVSNYLPDSNKCTITDFVNKGDIEYIQYDLNAPKMVDFGDYDYAIFSGVLEYITNLPAKIKYISNRCANIVVSYSTLNEYPENRDLHGWMNSYTNHEFIKLFSDADMKLEKCIPWKKTYITPNGNEYKIHQHIYKFSKNEI